MIDINTPADLQNQVLSAKLAILDFWAPWCGPCKMVAPVLEKLEANNPGLVVAKVNVDANKELAGAFKVRSIPTIVLLKDGQVFDTVVGAQSLENLQQFVDSGK